MSSPKYLWTLCTIGMFSGIGAGYASPARAGTLHQGWNYAIDSFNDGFDQGNIGSDSEIELYGMAMQEANDSLYFAFNSNLGLEGLLNRRAYNRRISYSDLFLNFSPTSSLDSLNNTSTDATYGIRFDTTNDSRLAPGLYQGISAASLSRANTGFASLEETHDVIESLGGTVSYGDLAADASYFDQQSPATTTMVRGTYLGDVELITDVTDLGLDFSTFGATGTHTFGIRVNRSFLPSSEFTAHLFIESGNDGIALEGVLGDRSAQRMASSRTIPEPGSLMGIGLLGLATIGRRLWKQLNAEVSFS